MIKFADLLHIFLTTVDASVEFVNHIKRVLIFLAVFLKVSF